MPGVRHWIPKTQVFARFFVVISEAGGRAAGTGPSPSEKLADVLKAIETAMTSVAVVPRRRPSQGTSDHPRRTAGSFLPNLSWSDAVALVDGQSIGLEDPRWVLSSDGLVGGMFAVMVYVVPDNASESRTEAAGRKLEECRGVVLVAAGIHGEDVVETTAVLQMTEVSVWDRLFFA